MSQKIQSITGMNDALPQDIFLWQQLEKKARALFENYGFAEIRTPILEETALFSRGMGENTQVVQKEMYTFEDRGGDLVTMRPEGTAGVIRAYLQHSLNAQEAVSKLYYMGPMFRYERPQKGRLRQFHQIGVETIGVDSPYADAEAVIMLYRLTQNLGISHFRLEINSLGTAEERVPYIKELVSFLNESANLLCDECRDRIQKNPLRVLDCKKESCKKVTHHAPTILDSLGSQSRQDFEAFKTHLINAGIEFKVNPSLVRGLDYYEKTTFEFISDDLGSQSAFAGGGRYSKLAQELGAKTPIPSVGFSIGCERMIMLMADLSIYKNHKPALSGVYFVGMNDNCFQECQKIMQRVRDTGIRADMDYSAKSVKSQMRRANKFFFKYAAILGDSEIEKGVVAFKNLETGEQAEVFISDISAMVK